MEPFCQDILQVSLDINVCDIEISSKILAQTEGKGIDLYNLELYSQEAKYSIDKEIAFSNAKKYKEALEALLTLIANGYKAFYGWKKGDGFWVSFQGHALRVENGKSGNPYFLLTSEVFLLIEQFPNN
jgi:hypothetical protein